MKTAIALVAAAAILSGCATGAIPQDDDALGVAADVSSPKKKAPKVSSCDQAREAFLTGSEADVRKALKRLKADRKADATAREYAKYYLGRDRNDRAMRELDESLISTSCSY